jgi:hypothetical protein
VATLKSSNRRVYLVKTSEAGALRALGFEMGAESGGAFEVYVREEEVDRFIKKLAGLRVTGLDVRAQSLEDIFLNFYGMEAR